VAKKAQKRSRPSSGTIQKGKPHVTRGRRKTAEPTVSRLWKQVSPERKLDILGVILALLGFISFVSLLSRQQGILTQWWVNTLLKGFGLGAFVLPIALVGLGLWLVFRNIDRLPLLSLERSVGILLLFFNILTWLNIFVRDWKVEEGMSGGGSLGALVDGLLVKTLGTGGMIIAMIAWFLISLSMTLDISLMDLSHALKPVGTRLKNALERQLAKERRIPEPVEKETVEELPPTFKRIRPVAAETPVKGLGMVPAQRTRAASTLAEKEPVVRSIAGKSTAVVPTTPWKLPDLAAILDVPTPVAAQENYDQETARKIEQTLASFGVPGHIVEIQHGPTITMFGLEPDFIESRHGRTRVRVNKITALVDDLALSLAAERIRIQAPVPGRNYVGIEVPNSEISRVTLLEVMESQSFKRLRSSLRFALGKNVSGRAVAVDMPALPHLLIAGTTGSGKSVCVNAILSSFLLHNTPLDLRLVLIDPKRVELTPYNGIPHLLAPVVTDTDRVINALQWMTREMDSRYHKFNKARVRNIQEFNLKNPAERLPYLLVVIDELADLMMLAPDETERSITRLAQLARATGIHLILATQRPSTDVITGLIKANFPARVAFAVFSQVDSRVILDQPGAERLLGRGDMLFQSPDAAAPVRLQGVFVSDNEIQRLVDYWRNAALDLPEGTRSTEMAADADLPRGVPLKQDSLFDDGAEEGDPVLNEAIDLVRREGRASITMLQRRMRIGYTRAARLIDVMEERGIVSPVQPNSQVREVLDYGPTSPPRDEE
jgi:DNA segregation ATPase FtsK/SpoIIIE, S-DNA-T family